jgi:hypothetical protein
MAAYTNGHEDAFITPNNKNTAARVSGSLTYAHPSAKFASCTSLAPDVQVFI